MKYFIKHDWSTPAINRRDFDNLAEGIEALKSLWEERGLSICKWVRATNKEQHNRCLILWTHDRLPKAFATRVGIVVVEDDKLRLPMLEIIKYYAIQF
jgi:hypothetical protein